MKAMVWGKFVGLAVVLVLLLLGLGQITGIVTERQFQRSTAIQSIAQSLAGNQTLLGPLVHRACVEEWGFETVPARDGKPAETNAPGRREFMLVAAPTTLQIGGTNQMEARARGLHATQVFHQQTTLSANWSDLNTLQAERSHPGSRLQCGPALLMLSVSDARGIRQVDVTVNGQPTRVLAGTFLGSYPRGIHASLPSSLDMGAALSAEIKLELTGTEHFGVVPLGGATSVHLRSNWPHPSFDGQFLPVERQWGDAGFDATWRVSSLASSAQQNAMQGRRLCGAGENSSVGSGAPEASSTKPENGCVETVGVTYIDPSNTYALSNRATKYGILFIVLTFTAVGLFEILRSLRVHPLQYFLVGAAISIFFLLLVSLSEHFPFVTAYAVAASACVLLLAYYASHMLQSWKLGLPFGLGVGGLYGLLYVLLLLEQTALAVGSVALFVVLALVMLLTRKVDWYARLRLEALQGPAG